MRFTTTSRPPRIMHYPYRPSGYKEMTAEASRKVRLSKRAEKL